MFGKTQGFAALSFYQTEQLYRLFLDISKLKPKKTQANFRKTQELPTKNFFFALESPEIDRF